MVFLQFLSGVFQVTLSQWHFQAVQLPKPFSVKKNKTKKAWITWIYKFLMKQIFTQEVSPNSA